MHILVTGGTGFIGQRLCAHLQQAGHAVSVLTRDPMHARVPGARCIGTLAQARGIDAVVNLAGAPLFDRRWTPARKAIFRASRLGTTRDLLAWMQVQPERPRVLVSGSAIGYYGLRGDEELGEDAAPGEDFAARLCRDWEHEAAQAESLGVRVCRVRSGIVLGPGGALQRMRLPFLFGAGGPMGDGRQWMSWIHRDDLVALIAWLLQQPDAEGPWNGTAPQPARNVDFARTLGEVLRRPALLPAPAFALKLAFGEMADMLLGGQRVLPVRALHAGFVFTHPTLDGALRAIERR